MSKFIEAYEMGCENTNRLDRLFEDEFCDVTDEEIAEYVINKCSNYDGCKEFLLDIHEIRKNKK